MSAALTIAPDTVVTLSYVLLDARGEQVDRVTKEEPLTYVHGYAQIVPGLERQIAGLAAGAKGTFDVEADEAFGERDEDAVFAVDRTDFPDAEDVAVGDEFMAEGPDGEPIAMRVTEIREDALVVDTNHPLAGQRIRFEVEVASVREATEDEIAAAQAELEQVLADEEEGCGCGHDHGEEGHEHGEDGHEHGPGHDHDHGAPTGGLVQLSKKGQA
jgi:FKBP-type peptidyl-prolyl cis-trans isomerase SlyD